MNGNFWEGVEAHRKRSFLDSPYHQSPEMHSKLERNKKQHSTIEWD